MGKTTPPPIRAHTYFPDVYKHKLLHVQLKSPNFVLTRAHTYFLNVHTASCANKKLQLCADACKYLFSGCGQSFMCK